MSTDTIFDQLDEEEKKKQQQSGTVFDALDQPSVFQASGTVFDRLDQQQPQASGTVFDQLDQKPAIPAEPQKPDFIDYATQQIIGGASGLGGPLAKYAPLNLLLKMSSETPKPTNLDVPNPQRKPFDVAEFGWTDPRAKPINLVSKGIDLLARGQYASAMAAHKLLQAYGDNKPDDILSALKTAGVAAKDELINPQARLSYTDIMNKYMPDFAKAHPLAAELAGFLGDVALDPTTYFSGVKDLVTVPTQMAQKSGRLALTKLGEKEMGKILRTGVTRDVAETAFRKMFGEIAPEEAGKLISKEKRVFFLPSKWAGMDIPGLSKKPNVLRLQQDALETNRIAAAIKTLKENQKLAESMPARSTIETTIKEYEAAKKAALDPIRQEVNLYSRPESPEAFKAMEQASRQPKAEIPTLSGIEPKKTAFDLMDTQVGDRYDFLKRQQKWLRDFISMDEKKLNVKDAEQMKRIDMLNAQLFRVDKELGRFTPLPEVTPLIGLNKMDRQFEKGAIEAERFGNLRGFHEQRLGEAYQQLSQWDQLDKQAEDLRRVIAGPERPPRPLIIPDTHPIDAPFRALEKVPGLRDIFEDVRPGQSLQRMKNTADYMVGSLFKRYDSVKESVAGLIDKAQVKLMNSAADQDKYAMEFYKGLNRQEQRQVVETMFEVEKEVAKWQDANKLDIPDADLGELRAKVLNAIPESKGDKALTAKARAAYLRYVVEDKAKGELYQDLGIIEHLQKGHAYHLAKNIDPELAYRYSRFKRFGPSEFFGAGEQKFYKDIDEFRAAGYKPVMNAALLMASYNKDAERALINRELMKDIAMHYGVKDINEVKNVVSPKEWDRLNHELQYMASPNYSIFKHHEWWKKFARGWDIASTPFRAGATYGNPAFVVPQLFGNSLQWLMDNGRKAYRILDPLTHYATFKTVAEHGGWLQHLPETPFSSLFNRIGNIGRDARSAIGESISLRGLANEMKDAGVMQDVHVGSGNRMGRRFQKEMYKNEMKDASLRALKLTNKPVFEGLGEFVKQMANYHNWPEFAENYGKAFTYINGRLIGQGPKQAERTTFRTMYNYGRGLSEIERQIVKRFLGPFYSYPRFTAELAATNLFNSPGNVAAVKKGIDHLISAYGKIAKQMRGEDTGPLTKEERAAVPGYMLEMPSAYLGTETTHEGVKHVFNSFPNFSPIDTFMMLEQGQFDSKTNISRSFEKNILGILHPFLKIPVEHFLNREFYSGRPIQRPNDEVTKGKPNMTPIGKNQRAEQVLSDALMALGGAEGGTMGAIGGKLFGQAAAGLGGAALLKKMLGWEEFVQPDGSTQVYVSPFKYHAYASYFPMLRRVIRWDDESKTANERNFEFFSRVLIQKRDLKQDFQTKGLQLKKEFGKRKNELIKDEMLNQDRIQSQRDWEQLMEAKRKWQEILKFQEEYDQVDPNNIR